MQSQEQLKTPDEIIRRAGGPSKVARRFGVRQSTVSGWKERGFPPSTYSGWQRILQELKVSAPAELWKQKEVTE
jgi:hypothetical protein